MRNICFFYCSLLTAGAFLSTVLSWGRTAPFLLSYPCPACPCQGPFIKLNYVITSNNSSNFSPNLPQHKENLSYLEKKSTQMIRSHTSALQEVPS